MAKGKRFYKRNNNAPAGEGAPEQNVNQAAGDNVKTNYEGRPNGAQGGKPGKPGQKPAPKPGGKPPRKFMKDKNRDGNPERNDNRQGGREGNAANRGNGERSGNRPEGNAERRGNRPGNNRPNRPRFENRKPQMAGRLLVAYYSWSGVTDKAAQKIASVAKGNTWRINPVNAYPSMYGLCVAKAGMEKASGARPEIKGTLPDCSRYEKIAIGFPIWWFNCPNIILSFLEKVNLEGKKVYPFCTSKTSGPKSSADTIRKTVPKADVKDCLDANKLGDMSDEEIKKWLEM
ncbi:MAG: flavodoxin [Succiniclasticum sp.]